MTRTWLMLMLIGLVPGLGCGARGHLDASRVVVFVPGVGGDGPWYGGLKRGLGNVQLQTHSWGAPLPLFALNFSNKGIHNAAEKKLAERLRRIARQQPDARIDVVAHSAGCGVALGALGRLNQPIPRAVVLLAPSVSPGYDLAPSLAGVGDAIHVFHSDRDTLFLSWRTSRFGTYDNVKTRAAGNTGFDLTALPPALRSRVAQRAYDARWNELGHDGGHDGPVARAFVETVVAPLLETAATPVAPSRSFAESPR